MTKMLCRTALLGALAFAPIAANAGTITFAQFAQIDNVTTFRYLNQDTVKKGVITPQAQIISVVKTGSFYNQDTPIVNFTALMDGPGGSGISAGDTVQAYLNLDATSTMAATNTGGTLSQLFDGFVSFTSVDTGDLLLEADFIGAELSATGGSFSFTVGGNSGTGTVDYLSDVFIGLGADNDFSISGTGTNTTIKYSAGHSLNYRPGFRGSLAGTFSTLPTQAPEPASLALLGLGLAALGLRRRAV